MLKVLGLAVLSGILLIALVIVTFIALTLFLRLTSRPSPRISMPWALALFWAVAIAWYGCLFASVIWSTKGKYRLTWNSLGFRRPRRKDSYLPLVGIIGAFAITAAYEGLVSQFHVHGLQPTSNLPPSLLQYRAIVPVTLLGACVVAPIAEESIFRCLIFRGLLGKHWPFGVMGRTFGFWSAALISGLIFALAHGQFGLVIPFTCVGALWAWLYWRSGSIWSDILAHAGYNLISLIVALFFVH